MTHRWSTSANLYSRKVWLVITSLRFDSGHRLLGDDYFRRLLSMGKCRALSYLIDGSTWKNINFVAFRLGKQKWLRRQRPNTRGADSSRLDTPSHHHTSQLDQAVKWVPGSLQGSEQVRQRKRKWAQLSQTASPETSHSPKTVRTWDNIQNGLKV